jgi:Predicted transcriptional regulators
MEAEGESMLSTNASKALAYLKENPNSSATDIGVHLGTTRNNAMSILYGLERKGFVASSIRDGAIRPVVFRALDMTDPTTALFDRARQLGGPFGILMAQVMA